MRRRVAALVCLLVACLATGRAQQAATPPPSGAITGVALDAGTGQPLGEAVVSLTATIAGQAGMNMQVTDRSGRFAFTKLPVATFTLSASKLGYFDGGYGQTPLRTTTRRIALAEGQWLQYADVRLWRHSSISGTVLDEAGEPVVDIWVRAAAQIPVAGRARWVLGPFTKTDDRGFYRFAGLGAGKWTVMVPSVQFAVPSDTSIYTLSGTTPENAAGSAARGRPFVPRSDPTVPAEGGFSLVLGGSATPPAAAGQPQLYPVTYLPSARSISDAAVVTLAGEDRSGADIALRPVRGFKVSGTLQGPAESITGLVIRLTPAGDEGLGNELATSLVAASGTFQFPRVPAGSYTIVVDRSASGYSYNLNTLSAPTRVPDPPGQAPGGIMMRAVASAFPGVMLETRTQQGNASLTARLHIDVVDRDVTGLGVAQTRGASMSGRVVLEEAADKNRPAGMPFVDLIAESANGDPSLGQLHATVNRNDPNMPFTIDGLQDGAYLLTTIGGGLIKSIAYDGKDHAFVPFEVTGGRDISGVVITLTRQSTKVSGTIRDSQGRPVGDALVMFFPVDRSQWSNYGVQPARLRAMAVPNSGLYDVQAMPAGDYFVVAVKDELTQDWKDPAFLAKAAAVADRVSLGWGDTKSLELKLVEIR